MNKKKKTRVMLILSCMCLLFIAIACEDDKVTDSLHLSATNASVDIGEEFSVDISLDQLDQYNKIVVEKTINGKKAEYSKTLTVKDLTFPYTFTEKSIAEDAKGVVVYSFYGYDANGGKIDASDIVLTIKLAQLPLLLKYDWALSKQIIQGDDWVTNDMKDDLYRFNDDFSWQLDWGTIISGGGLEKLNSFCAWKIDGTDTDVKALYMIKYNIFAPGTPIITKFNVLKLQDRTMVLESFLDLSFFGMSDNERVEETYIPVNKTPNFTPYRGSNPNDYSVAACKPGSY